MICLDANVLLEIIADRTNAQACRSFIGNTDKELVTTMLSVDLVFYFVEAKKLQREPAEAFLRKFTWLPLTEADGEQAFRTYDGRDFEDALQIACALREGCSEFVTLDKALAKKYADTLAVRLLT